MGFDVSDGAGLGSSACATAADGAEAESATAGVLSGTRATSSGFELSLSIVGSASWVLTVEGSETADRLDTADGLLLTLSCALRLSGSWDAGASVGGEELVEGVSAAELGAASSSTDSGAGVSAAVVAPGVGPGPGEALAGCSGCVTDSGPDVDPAGAVEPDDGCASDDALESDDEPSGVSATATPCPVATAPHTPSATASAPTRPTCAAATMSRP